MMKKYFLVCLLGFLFVGCSTEIAYFNLQDALNDPKAKEILEDDVELSFGQKSQDTKGEVITTSKRTTLAGKGSAEKAYRWALYSAIKQFQYSARKQGSIRVVNIVGNWKHKVYDSSEKFQCALGNMLAGVALKGEIVK